MRVLAPWICPQTGNIKLLQPPSMVLNLAEGSQTGFGKQASARSISAGDKNPTGSSISDLKQMTKKKTDFTVLRRSRLQIFVYGIFAGFRSTDPASSVCWSCTIFLSAIMRFATSACGQRVTRRGLPLKSVDIGQKKKKKNSDGKQMCTLNDRFATEKNVYAKNYRRQRRSRPRRRRLRHDTIRRPAVPEKSQFPSWRRLTASYGYAPLTTRRSRPKRVLPNPSGGRGVVVPLLNYVSQSFNSILEQ